MTIIHREKLAIAEEEYAKKTRALEIEINVLLERLRAKDREIEELNITILKFSDYKALKEEIAELKRKLEKLKVDYKKVKEELEKWKKKWGNHKCKVVYKYREVERSVGQFSEDENYEEVVNEFEEEVIRD